MHTAQGVTADTMHGVVTGEESRQQLYTMLTRGRSANHVYVAVVGDGDPHTVIQPNNVHLRTATDLLEQILARDTSPQSATTLQREQQDPGVRLAASVERYIDALHVAAEEVIGSSAVQALEAFANQLVPGLADEPAWPSLRAHLLLLAVDGKDPQQPLRAAYNTREVGSATDRAAVLDWRLHETTLPSGEGPLSWLPGIPGRIAANPRWGPYLHARSHLVEELADQIRTNTAAEAPAWAQRHAHMPTELIADMHVWRAANQIEPDDLRPTGPTQHGRAAQAWQQRLDKRLAAADTRTEWRWRQLLAAEAPTTTPDPFLPQLTERLSNLTRAGFDATLLVRSAAAAGPLPDDHPAAALWWRILDQLPPQAPNQGSTIPDAVPGSRNTRTRSHDHRSPRPRSAPPPAFGPSR